MGSQGSMLPSESRKLAHLALQVKEPSPEVRRRPPPTLTQADMFGRECSYSMSIMHKRDIHCASQFLSRTT